MGAEAIYLMIITWIHFVGALNPISNLYTLFYLRTEPTTTVLGAPELFIDTTSTINLTCIVQGLNEPPTTIGWTHNGYEINYDR